MQIAAEEGGEVDGCLTHKDSIEGDDSSGYCSRRVS